MLIAKDIPEKYRAYCLLYDFSKKKDQILSMLKLPKYEVPWIKVIKFLNSQIDNESDQIEEEEIREEVKEKDERNNLILVQESISEKESKTERKSFDESHCTGQFGAAVETASFGVGHLTERSISTPV